MKEECGSSCLAALLCHYCFLLPSQDEGARQRSKNEAETWLHSGTPHARRIFFNWAGTLEQIPGTREGANKHDNDVFSNNLLCSQGVVLSGLCLHACWPVILQSVTWTGSARKQVSTPGSSRLACHGAFSTTQKLQRNLWRLIMSCTVFLVKTASPTQQQKYLQ